jgi:hypothetical protein
MVLLHNLVFVALTARFIGWADIAHPETRRDFAVKAANYFQKTAQGVGKAFR